MVVVLVTLLLFSVVATVVVEGTVVSTVVENVFFWLVGVEVGEEDGSVVEVTVEELVVVLGLV